MFPLLVFNTNRKEKMLPLLVFNTNRKEKMLPLLVFNTNRKMIYTKAPHSFEQGACYFWK
jgi:hypothetical protein